MLPSMRLGTAGSREAGSEGLLLSPWARARRGQKEQTTAADERHGSGSSTAVALGLRGRLRLAAGWQPPISGLRRLAAMPSSGRTHGCPRVRDWVHASGSPFLRPHAQRRQRSDRGGPPCPHRNPPDRRPPSSTPPSSWPSRLARTVARPWSRFVANSTSSRSRRSPRSSTAWNCKPTACATLRGTDAINRLLKLTDVEGLLVLVDDPDDLVPPPLAH